MQSVEPILDLLFSDNSTHRQLSNFSRHPPPMLEQTRNKLDKGTPSSSNHQASIEHNVRLEAMSQEQQKRQER